MKLLKKTDVLVPAPPATVRLTGNLGDRIDALVSNSVLIQDRERFLRPFRDKDEVGNGDWRCEYWGKWASAAALACADRPTRENIALLREAARELIATQDADGYIGTRKREHRLQGWDVWGRKYVLLGLLGIYDVTGDQFIRDAASRHADSLISECGPGGVNIAAIGYPAWKGLPPSSVLEPIVLLYQRSGEQKHLDFASAGNLWSEQSLYRVWLPQLLNPASVWQAGSPRWWQKFRDTRPEMLKG